MRRLFIAIELPADVASKIDMFARKLSEKLYVRSVPKEKLHITMVFLGDPKTDDSDIISAVKRQKVGRRIELDGLGAFPSFERPHVLFIGVKTDLSDVYSGLGFLSDKPFVPHITICRFNGSIEPSLKERLEHTDFKAEFYADGLSLFNSDIKTYTRLV